jgi:hypothetical protein
VQIECIRRGEMVNLVQNHPCVGWIKGQGRSSHISACIRAHTSETSRRNCTVTLAGGQSVADPQPFVVPAGLQVGEC